jgi:pimeloyl-ACP methyl ester carboxylesterase
MTDRIQRAAVGDLEIAYESFGDSANPPLLLVMGLATQMLGWDERFCIRLADHGFRVIRFDNRDIGLSTHLSEAGVPDVAALLGGDQNSPAPPYTLLDMARDTAGLLDALGLESAHVVGASMGGMIAQQLAVGRPDRVRSLTSIMSTPCREVGQARPEAMAVLFLPPPRDSNQAAERALQVYRVIGSPGYPLDGRTSLVWRDGRSPAGTTPPAWFGSCRRSRCHRTVRRGCVSYAFRPWSSTARTIHSSRSTAGRRPPTRFLAPGSS